MLVVEERPVHGALLHAVPGDALRGVIASETQGVVTTTMEGATALRVLEQRRCRLVVLDLHYVGLDGLALLDRIRDAHPDVPVLAVLRADDPQLVAAALRRGAGRCLVRPYDPAELRACVAGALEETAPSDPEPTTPPSSRAFSDSIHGSSAAVVALREAIERAATSTAPVLISGESGAGKELVARAIHTRGARRQRPFVAVNVSAIPEALLENEMFGHVRGAFSGATQARRGLFVAADGGTLLLDEIGDMPPGLQAKLLRVLQLGEVRAVGSDSVRTVDVRVLSATNRDLHGDIASGRFRADLFYRLNVLPIRVPPLRERRDDIPELVEHFLWHALSRNPTATARTIESAAVRALREAAWPGNVRELAHVIERLVVFGPEACISARHAADALRPFAAAPPQDGARFELSTLQELNERYVAWVLQQTGGNKKRAAAILGVDLSTLYRWQSAKRAN